MVKQTPGVGERAQAATNAGNAEFLPIESVLRQASAKSGGVLISPSDRINRARARESEQRRTRCDDRNVEIDPPALCLVPQGGFDFHLLSESRSSPCLPSLGAVSSNADTASSPFYSPVADNRLSLNRRKSKPPAETRFPNSTVRNENHYENEERFIGIRAEEIRTPSPKSSAGDGACWRRHVRLRSPLTCPPTVRATPARDPRAAARRPEPVPPPTGVLLPPAG